jgi:lysophospholipase L1-like esterase
MQNLIQYLLILLLLAGCGRADQKNNRQMNETITFLALGDSYTIGESVSGQERWPVQLAETLTQQGHTTASPLIIARTGWTTDELMAGINVATIDPPYHLVSLLVGVNNQYRGWDIEEFRGEFTSLLDRAVEFAGDDPAKVFVVSIPDWGVTPFAEGRDREQIALEIDAFNNVKKEETEKRGILFIDITDISRLAEKDSSLLAADGLHPSGKMYALWVERISPSIVDKLN